MVNDIIVALIALLGSCCGSLVGIVTSAKLTNFRLESLEKKVDKHNNFAERIPLCEQNIKVINNRLSYIEEEMKH